MRAFTRKFSLQAAATNLKTNAIEDNLVDVFQIKVNGSHAVVNYEKINNNTYDLIHSSIPEEYHGQGLGHILAQRVFDHLQDKDKKFKITCEFLQHYYNKNTDKYNLAVISN